MSGPSCWPALDPAARYGLAGQVVEVLEPHTEADPAGLLFDFLTAFGCAVGPGPHAVADGAQHPARLNVVMVGETSRARKGTSRQQIRRVMVAADDRWVRDREFGGLASGEGLIAAVSDPPRDDTADDKPQRPVDKRLLVVEPEFARVLRVCARDGSTLSPIVRQAWDGGRLQVMTRRDPLSAEGAHISVIGHITAAELARTLTDTEAANGFANRFLFVAVRRSKLLPSGGNLDPGELDQLGRTVRTTLERARRVGTVRRDPDAEQRWADLYAHLADTEPPGLAGALTARAEAQLLRLSVAYALTDGTGTITVDHLDAASAAWNYADHTVRMLFPAGTGDQRADQLLRALTEAPDGLDRAGQYAVFSNHIGGTDLDHITKKLIDLGLAESAKEATGGRPRDVLLPTPEGTSLASFASIASAYPQPGTQDD